MKYSSIIFIALVVLFSSCSEEKETLFDFSGTYKYDYYCDEEGSYQNGEVYTLIITKTEVEGSYTVDFGDDVIFNAVQINNSLIIDRQTLNEDQGYDVVTMQGDIRKVETDITVSVTFSADGSEERSCSFLIIRQ